MPTSDVDQHLVLGGLGHRDPADAHTLARNGEGLAHQRGSGPVDGR